MSQFFFIQPTPATLKSKLSCFVCLFLILFTSFGADWLLNDQLFSINFARLYCQWGLGDKLKMMNLCLHLY